MPQPIMKKYSQGELGDAYSTKKWKQGDLGAESGSIGKKNKGEGLKAMGADDKSLSKSF